MKEWENSSIIAECADPESQDIRHALDNKQVLWRRKNNRVQVLAQTLSSFLDTRTSSLLAVNKKQGVPRKFIHREWKRTWVDLEGLKQRVNHTEHGSALLKGLKQVIHVVDELTTPDDQLVKTVKQSKPASAPLGSKRNPIDVCEVAVEANKRAVHNTERLNKLDHQVQDVDARAEALEHDVPQLLHEISYHSDSVRRLKKRVGVIEAGDKKAAQLMAAKHTPFDALSKRVNRMATQADRLDSKTDGLESRVSVLEDTSKWLSWSLAGLVSLRLLGLTFRLLRRQ